MNKLTILFLDIDGVFSMIDATQLPMERVGGIHVRPIPMANALLKAIDRQSWLIPLRVLPVWLSAWHTGALDWNERSLTGPWDVGYHLTDRQEKRAKELFPRLFEQRIDGKLIAAQYYLRRMWKNNPVVWIEDGFAPETIAWAKERGNVRLIDTLREPIRAQLLSEYEDYDKAAREFVEMCLSEEKE